MPYLRRGFGDLASTQSLITQTAAQYGVPSSIALAVAQKESGFNQSAVGSSGEIGVFQLMPGTAAGLGVNPSDLGQNVQGGISYLSSLFQQFGNWSQALMAYNGGPGNVTRGTVSTAAQNYASSILGTAGDSTTGLLSPSEGVLPEDTGASWGFESSAVDPILIGAAAIGLVLVVWVLSR